MWRCLEVPKDILMILPKKMMVEIVVWSRIRWESVKEWREECVCVFVRKKKILKKKNQRRRKGVVGSGGVGGACGTQKNWLFIWGVTSKCQDQKGEQKHYLLMCRKMWEIKDFCVRLGERERERERERLRRKCSKMPIFFLILIWGVRGYLWSKSDHLASSGPLRATSQLWWPFRVHQAAY